MKVLHEKDIAYAPNKESLSDLGEMIGRTAPIKSGDYSIAITHLDPGGSVIRHYHVVSDEVYLFTEGTCTMVVNGSAFDVQEGTVVVIEPNDWHEILPCQSPVAFYAVSFPPFVSEDFLTGKEKD